MSQKLKFLLFLAYAIPFPFFAVWWDAKTTGNLLGYFIMILCFALLCAISISRRCHWIMLAGNAVCVLCSFLCALPFRRSLRWMWYFDDFSGMQLLLFSCIAIFYLELLALYFKKEAFHSFTFWFALLGILIVWYNLKGLDDKNILMIGFNPVLLLLYENLDLRPFFSGLWHFLSLFTMSFYGFVLDGLKARINSNNQIKSVR